MGPGSLGPGSFGGPYHHFYGAAPLGGGPGFAGPTLALAATTLLWLAALTWLLWPSIRARLQPSAQPERPAEEAEPSAVELLRQRYVLGELDAFTFEDMLDHLLVSQVREQEFYRKEALHYRAGQELYHMPTGAAPHMQANSLDELIGGYAPVPPVETVEPDAGYD